jgi:hypothetical protein
MLQEKLYRNSKSQEPRHVYGHAESKKRETCTRELEGLVERVFHEAVEPIHPLNGVMDSMEAPQQLRTVAYVVCERDAYIGNSDREQNLEGQGPARRPQSRIGEERREQWERHY